MNGRLRRTIAPVGLAAVLLVGAGCGDDSDDSEEAEAAEPLPTHTIAARSYTQKPPVSTQPEDADLADVAPGETVEVEQEYEVGTGDYMYQIAEMFEVDAEEIARYNRFVDGVDHQLQPGETIRIPPGGVRPGGEETTTTTEPLAGADVADDSEASEDSDGSDGSQDGSDDGQSTQGAGDNCGEATYVLEPNDYPLGVANKFDTTLDALNEANKGLPGYDTFYPGTEIVIPAKSDC